MPSSLITAITSSALLLVSKLTVMSRLDPFKVVCHNILEVVLPYLFLWALLLWSNLPSRWQSKTILPWNMQQILHGAELFPFLLWFVGWPLLYVCTRRVNRKWNDCKFVVDIFCFMGAFRDWALTHRQPYSTICYCRMLWILLEFCAVVLGRQGGGCLCFVRCIYHCYMQCFSWNVIWHLKRKPDLQELMFEKPEIVTNFAGPNRTLLVAC